jgi:hypothetical protein
MHTLILIISDLWALVALPCQQNPRGLSPRDLFDDRGNLGASKPTHLSQRLLKAASSAVVAAATSQIATMQIQALQTTSAGSTASCRSRARSVRVCATAMVSCHFSALGTMASASWLTPDRVLLCCRSLHPLPQPSLPAKMFAM